MSASTTNIPSQGHIKRLSMYDDTLRVYTVWWHFTLLYDDMVHWCAKYPRSWWCRYLLVNNFDRYRYLKAKSRRRGTKGHRPENSPPWAGNSGKREDQTNTNKQIFSDRRREPEMQTATPLKPARHRTSLSQASVDELITRMLFTFLRCN